ncbi:hypothetical protein acdb102_24100 [Acidothermaceae bacterium B102]|nr:hypothetical protein acdb102_24100 [Acidothermaceae bacterium B102]
MADPEVVDRVDETLPTDDVRSRVRVVGAWTLTGLASLLLWVSLALPSHVSHLSPWLFLRIPVEALVAMAICLFLPVRARRVVATVLGIAFAALALAKLLDVGFWDVLDRPFNPVTDTSYLGPAAGVLRDSIGPGRAVAVEVGVGLVLVALVVFFPLAVLRLTRISARHRRRSAQTVTVLGLVWTLCATFGLQAGAGISIASGSTASLAYDQIDRVRAGLHDQKTFQASIAATDGYTITPGANLLTGLRGKDVIIAFVESYGQVAVQGSTFSPPVDAVLKAGTSQLAAAGFASRSAFLTSPTFGGISWLAHSTLQTGLWIENQQRYNQVVASSRFTLSDAFKRAGWRTVSDVPSDRATWTFGTSFYHYDHLYDAYNVGYAGPKFSYASMPDQFTLETFDHLELSAPHRSPVMAEIDLVSSHTPWTPLPHLVGWNQVGDGSIYDGMPAQGQKPSQVWPDASKVQAVYGQSIQYSLGSLISFVQNAHDDNLVLVVLGDHQPATIVSGQNASHNVPITVIAHDPKVMARISSWGWQAGMLPDPQAPVWSMDAFRNRFLTAYGPR